MQYDFSSRIKTYALLKRVVFILLYTCSLSKEINVNVLTSHQIFCKQFVKHFLPLKISKMTFSQKKKRSMTFLCIHHILLGHTADVLIVYAFCHNSQHNHSDATALSRLVASVKLHRTQC